jgi:hypothetical protein
MMFPPLPGEIDQRSVAPRAGAIALPSWLARRDVAAAVIAGLFAMQAAIRFTSHLSGDVAWYLYAAGRLLDGATLYVDVIEVSSPLGLWLTMPVVAMARAIAVSPIVVLKILFLILTLVSILLSGRLMSLVEDLPAEARNLLLIVLAALLLFLPGADFGQREHVAILLVTPWLLLQWLRFLDRDVPAGLAVLIGVLAAPGLLIKPHFIFAFLAVLLVVAAVGHNWRNLVRVENLLILLAVALYAAAGQLLLVRRYDMSIFSTYVYVPFYSEPVEVLAGELVLPGILALAAVIAAGRGDERLSMLQMLALVAGVVFVFAGGVQVGLAYHFLPARYCLTLAVAAGAVALVREASGWRDWLPLGLSIAALLLVVATVLPRQLAEYRGADFAEAIAREAPGADAIFIASNRVGDAFPLVVENDLTWASRFARQWPLRFVATTLGGELMPDHYHVRFVIDSLIADLTAHEPDIVFVEQQETAPPRDAFDHLGFWQRDTRFDEIWALYEERAPIEGFKVFVRK